MQIETAVVHSHLAFKGVFVDQLVRLADESLGAGLRQEAALLIGMIYSVLDRQYGSEVAG